MIRDAVWNRRILAPFLERASYSRVTVELIGDSNIIHNGSYDNTTLYSGHSQGMMRAWTNRFGAYALSIMPGLPGGGFPYNYYQTGGSWPVNLQNQNPPTSYDWTIFPASHQQFIFDGANAQSVNNGWMNYTLYVPPGIIHGSADPDANTYLSMAWPGLIDPAKNIRWHHRYGTFSSGSGSFRRCSQNATDVYYTPASTGADNERAYKSASISTNTGTDGMAWGYLDLPVNAARTHPRIFAPSIRTESDQYYITGPYIQTYQQIEDVAATRGVCVNVFIYQGGIGTRGHAATIQAMGTTAFFERLDAATHLQNQTQDMYILFHVISGGNDDGDNVTSVGPHPAASSTIAGKVDNSEAILIQLTTRCAAWDASRADGRTTHVIVMFGPYQPQSTHDYHSYYDALVAGLGDKYADTRVICDGTMLATPALWTARQYYNQSSAGVYDMAHGGGPANYAAMLIGEDGYDMHGTDTVDALAPVPQPEIMAASGITTMKGIVRDPNTGKVWDTTYLSFATRLDADISHYLVAAPESGTSGRYSIPLPILPYAGRFEVEFQEGATVGAVHHGVVSVEWTGFATPDLPAVTSDVPTVAQNQAGLAVPGSKMDLVDAPNATAVTAVQSGLETASAATTNTNTITSAISGIVGTGLTDAQAKTLNDIQKVVGNQ